MQQLEKEQDLRVYIHGSEAAMAISHQKIKYGLYF